MHRIQLNDVLFISTLLLCVGLQLNIRMGRALQLGEHRVDVHRLDVHCEDETEHSKLLTETIIVSGMTVLQSKHMIVSEVRDKCGLEISVGRYVNCALV